MIRLLANPAAGRGRARRLIPAAHAAFAPLGADLRETLGAGDEARLVHEALDDGCRTIVALGGDGTWSKVAAAIVNAGSDCTLVPLAGGTGNDFAKSLGIPARDPLAMARLAAEGATRRVDVGFIDNRCFVNAAGFGFDTAVLTAAAGRTWSRGDALYLACALGQLFGYPGLDAAVGEATMRRHLLLVIANGARFGGNFRIAPEADVADGALDIIAIGDADPLRRVLILGAAVTGRHVRMPGVVAGRARELTLRFSEAPAFEADGDLCRARAPEVQIRCRPGALRVIAAPADRG